MQAWIVGGAWLLAAVFALVVMGFAGFELRWKSRRLQEDRAQLEVLVAELTATTGRLQTAAARARAVRSTVASTGDSRSASPLTS